MTEKHVNDMHENGFFEILKKDHEYAMSEYLKKPKPELDSIINQLSDEEKFILMAMMIKSSKGEVYKMDVEEEEAKCKKCVHNEVCYMVRECLNYIPNFKCNCFEEKQRNKEEGEEK